jgi:hypothetical protein
MALELQGKIFKIMSEQTGEGKNGTWSKRDFVIETQDQFPKKICFSAWGDKSAEVGRLGIGTPVKIAFDVQSREYNEKWYTDLRPWKIDVLGAGDSAAPSQDFSDAPMGEISGDTDDLPF